MEQAGTPHNARDGAQTTMAPYPDRRRDSNAKSGRHWGQIGLQHRDTQTLAQPNFIEWLDQPQSRHARGSGLLTSASTDSGRRERQFLFTSLAEDRAAFEGSAQYSPLLWDEYAPSMPEGVAAAILRVRERVAFAAGGGAWNRRWRPLSVQITFMEAHDVRGEHNDLEAQGTFIATYTAQGSGAVRLYYTRDEEAPPDAVRGHRAPSRHVMERQQDVGYFYCMDGASLEKGTYHGVSAGEHGRLGLTFRFTDVLSASASASVQKRGRRYRDNSDGDGPAKSKKQKAGSLNIHKRKKNPTRLARDAAAFAAAVAKSHETASDAAAEGAAPVAPPTNPSR
jgi:hypothetical protein